MAPVVMVGVRLDAADVDLVATFWADVLECQKEGRSGGVTAVIPNEPANYQILITPAKTPKPDQNRIHFDLTSPSDRAMQDAIARARQRGTTHRHRSRAVGAP